MVCHCSRKGWRMKFFLFSWRACKYEVTYHNMFKMIFCQIVNVNNSALSTCWIIFITGTTWSWAWESGRINKTSILPSIKRQRRSMMCLAAVAPPLVGTCLYDIIHTAFKSLKVRNNKFTIHFFQILDCDLRLAAHIGCGYQNLSIWIHHWNNFIEFIFFYHTYDVKLF